MVYTWIGGRSGKFDQADNWISNYSYPYPAPHPPGPEDIADFSHGVVVQGAGDVLEIDFHGSMTFDGTFTAAQGIHGSGAVVNEGDITSTDAGFGAVVLQAGDVTNETGASIIGAANGVNIEQGTGTVLNYGAITGGVGFSGIALEAGGFITNNGTAIGGGHGIFITGAAGTVLNYGTATGGGSGIGLQDGGYVSNSALISGGEDGMFITGVAGSVNNQGTIISSATTLAPNNELWNGVILPHGGSVVNGSSDASAALIEAYQNGVAIGGAFGNFYPGAIGTVTNFGTIESTGLGNIAGSGVALGEGGTIDNYGVIASAGAEGVAITHAAGTVVNSGTIEGTTGIYASADPEVTNYGQILGADEGLVFRNAVGAVENFGVIEGVNDNGVYLGAGGKVANFGVIVGGGRGIELLDGGTVTNHGVVLGLGNSGISFHDKIGTVVNFGTIECDATGTLGAGVYLQEGGSIVNKAGGTIVAGQRQALVVENAAGTVSNYGAITGGKYEGIDLIAGGIVLNKGSVAGQGQGVKIAGGAGTVTNSGQITGSAYNSVELYAGGTVTNSGLLTTPSTKSSAVFIDNGPGVVINSGTIDNSAAVSGVHLVKGAVTNEAHGLIEGGLDGISFRYGEAGQTYVGAGTVTNSGTIEGVTHNGVYLADGGKITNGGLIEGFTGITIAAAAPATVVNSGTIESTGSVAVSFAPGGTDLLVVDPGAVSVGNVVGPGSGGTLELARGPKPGALSGLGTNFQFFGTLAVDPKATWILSGDASSFAVTNDGKILVEGKNTLIFGAVGEDKGAHGTIELTKKGAAEFAGAVDPKQSLVLNGTGDFVKLDEAASFAATISGIKKGDTIDLVETAATSVSFSKGKLAISDGSTTIATLSLKGHYTTKEFVLSSDHSGGTEITIGTPKGAAPVFVHADPGGGGAVFDGFAEGRGGFAASADGGASGADGNAHFAPAGGAGSGMAAASVGGGPPLLPWASDPFHFWTIQS